MEVDVKYESCNNWLEATISNNTIYVLPCTYCLEAQYDEGYEDGQQEEEA